MCLGDLEHVFGRSRTYVWEVYNMCYGGACFEALPLHNPERKFRFLSSLSLDRYRNIRLGHDHFFPDPFSFRLTVTSPLPLFLFHILSVTYRLSLRAALLILLMYSIRAR